MIVTVIVVDSPGARVTGAGSALAAGGVEVPAAAWWGPEARILAAVVALAAGAKPACQTSPVDEVRAGSKSLPRDTAARETEPAGAGPANGPVWPTSAAHRPGETWAAFTRTVAPLPWAAA